jgi:DNA-binding CsgD family transcriptional regulator
VLDGLAQDAGDAPLLVIADDIQLMDDMSALVLHQLTVQGIANVLLTMRSNESAPDTILALWKDEHLTRLDLQPLGRAESDCLVAAALNDPVSTACLDRLWDLTLGNVLFLRHLIEQETAAKRLMHDGDQWHWVGTPVVSPSLIDLVRLQIGVVPQNIRDVVDLLAVADPMEWSCLTTLVDASAIEDAARCGLIAISPDGETVTAGHPLYTEVRLTECGPPRLRQLRTAVVNALLARQPDSPVDPLRLGQLWLESTMPPDPEIFAAAAQCACARLDVHLAQRLAQAAFDADPTPQTRLLLAYIYYMRGNGPEVERLLAGFESGTGTTGFVGPTMLRAANKLWVLREPDASRDIVERALAAGDGDAGNLHTFGAFQSALAARPEAALRELSTVEFGELTPFGQVVGRCAQTLAAGDVGRIQDACDAAAAGYATLQTAPQGSMHEVGLAEMHIHALLLSGQVDAAAAVADAHYLECVDIPGLTRSMAAAMVGATALGRGDLPAAVRHLDAAWTEVQRDGDLNGQFYRFRITHTEALARSGRLNAAVAALDDTRAGKHAAYLHVEPAFLVAAAWVAAARGLVDEARRIACQAADFARQHGQVAREVLCLQTAVQFGFPAAVDRLEVLERIVEGDRARAATGYAKALAAGDGTAMEAVSADYQRLGDLLVAADASAQAAAIHRMAGRRGSALTANARAQQLGTNCGGAVSPALHAARIALPLTQREHEIVLLVAKGLTNREIAEATSLSVRTVEGHLYRASVKAGVTGRSELSALIADAAL